MERDCQRRAEDQDSGEEDHSTELGVCKGQAQKTLARAEQSQADEEDNDSHDVLLEFFCGQPPTRSTSAFSLEGGGAF